MIICGYLCYLTLLETTPNSELIQVVIIEFECKLSLIRFCNVHLDCFVTKKHFIYDFFWVTFIRLHTMKDLTCV